MFIHVLVALYVLSQSAFLPLMAESSSTGFLTPTPPSVTNSVGNMLRWVESGDQIVVSKTCGNLHEFEIPFIGILEVRDSSGITMFLAWQTGVVEPFDNSTIGASWLVEGSNTYYQARTFAFSDFEQYGVLSTVETSDFEVR